MIDLRLGDCLDVIGRFQLIDGVAMIQCYPSISGTEFNVFVVGEHYDDVLMDKLLDCEWQIGQQYLGRRFTFCYLPFIAERRIQEAQAQMVMPMVMA